MNKLLKNNLKYSLLTFTLLILLSTSTAHAEYSDKSKQMRDIPEERQQRQEERNQLRDEQCVQLQDRIQNRINAFNENKDGNVARYQEAKQRIADLISKLETQGVDVTTLKDHLDVFDGMITKYASVYVDFIESLKSTTQYICGESQGAFKDAMSIVRQKHQEVIAQRQDIHEYFIHTLKEDIKALRVQKEVTN